MKKMHRFKTKYDRMVGLPKLFKVSCFEKANLRGRVNHLVECLVRAKSQNLPAHFTKRVTSCLYHNGEYRPSN